MFTRVLHGVAAIAIVTAAGCATKHAGPAVPPSEAPAAAPSATAARNATGPRRASEAGRAAAAPAFVVRSFTPVERMPVASLGADDFVAPPTASPGSGMDAAREVVVVAGARNGERRTRTVRSEGDGTTVVEETGEAGVERTFLRRRTGGGYTLLSVDTPDEDSRSVFEAGLAFAPEELMAGASVESSSPMRVYLLSSQRERSSGHATRTMRITGTALVDVAGEALDATVVETRFEARLDAARAERRTTLYIVPGRGVVAEHWDERIVVLGIFPRKSSETTIVLPATAAPTDTKDAP